MSAIRDRVFQTDGVAVDSLCQYYIAYYGKR